MIKFYLSSIENLKSSYMLLQDYLEDYKISLEKQFDIRLAMYELCGNVFRHSNCPCELNVEISNNCLSLTIDSEINFEVQNLELSPLSESGRGVFLVKSIAEFLDYFDSGKHIIAKIRLNDN